MDELDKFIEEMVHFSSSMTEEEKVEAKARLKKDLLKKEGEV